MCIFSILCCSFNLFLLIIVASLFLFLRPVYCQLATRPKKSSHLSPMLFFFTSVLLMLIKKSDDEIKSMFLNKKPILLLLLLLLLRLLQVFGDRCNNEGTMNRVVGFYYATMPLVKMAPRLPTVATTGDSDLRAN